MEDRPRPASAKTVSVLVCPACPTLAAQKREFRRGPREADHLLFDQFRRSDSCRVQNKDRFQAEKLEAALKTWAVLGFLTSFDLITTSAPFGGSLFLRRSQKTGEGANDVDYRLRFPFWFSAVSDL